MSKRNFDIVEHTLREARKLSKVKARYGETDGFRAICEKLYCFRMRDARVLMRIGAQRTLSKDDHERVFDIWLRAVLRRVKKIDAKEKAIANAENVVPLAAYIRERDEQE